MTPEKLQQDLIEELAVLFSDLEFRDTDNKTVPMNFHKQMLPKKKSEDEEAPEEKFPWCIVKLRDNEVDGTKDMEQKQEIELWFGIYYDNPDGQYQHTMLTMFEKVKRRFLTNPVLSEFYAEPKMISLLNEEDAKTYPFYFGAMALTFLMPNYEREDEYS